MTRETKIGLLVGLAFIIVVGILLSEHLTTATERPAAQLAEAGHGVRAGVSSPGTPGMDATPLRAAEPQQQVKTSQDLTPPVQPPATKVIVGNPVAPTTPQTIVVHEQPIVAAPGTESPLPPQSPIVPENQVAKTQTATPNSVGPIVTDPFANDPLTRAAKEHGEAIVPVDSKTPGTATPSPIASNTTGAREYKAKPGDTLSRMAALLPGGATKANRDAIVAINPTLQKDPNKIISDRTYLLPADKAAQAPTGAIVTVKPETKPLDKVAEKAPEKPTDKSAAKPQLVQKPDAPGQRIYVVKAGDTLSKIAMNELGSKSQVGVLKELNADVLKGSDSIRTDMKLKLPAKSLASAE